MTRSTLPRRGNNAPKIDSDCCLLEGEIIQGTDFVAGETRTTPKGDSITILKVYQPGGAPEVLTVELKLTNPEWKPEHLRVIGDVEEVAILVRSDIAAVFDNAGEHQFASDLIARNPFKPGRYSKEGTFDIKHIEFIRFLVPCFPKK